MKTKSILFGAAAAVAACGAFAESELKAVAAFGGNEIRLYTEPLSYEVLSGGKTLVRKTAIGLKVDGKALEAGCECVSARSEEKGGSVATPVYKKASVDLSGVETVADFGAFAVRLAARRDGVAYRFELKKGGTIEAETASISIPADAACTFNRNTVKRLGCEETMPEAAKAGEIDNGANRCIYLPFYFETAGRSVVAMESDVRDYPVWNLHGIEKTADGTVRFDALFAKYPDKTEHAEGWGKEIVMEKGGRWIRVRTTKDWLAKAAGPRTLPWRVFAIARNAAELCENDMVYALAAPAAPGADFSWVRPGKVAWDWWNAFDNKGGEGCTTAGYKRFIDFASANGVEYVILDEGWSAKLDIWKFNPAVDVPQLIEYGKKKNVGIILWMAWAQLAGEEDKIAAHFSKMGAKGFKIDFMDRADAGMASFLETCAAACARHKMLIDYHGVYRPTGLHRMYPNILNYEGIHGLEQLKWAPKDKDMRYNDVACFFLRMSAGPMDYTPGAMDNYPLGEYGGSGMNPGSVGTRCHQMALMALYEAPLQMLCDSPTKYEKNMECFRFMAATPVAWDATKGLAGAPGRLAAAARKAKDGSWFASGITIEATPFTLDTSFLGAGRWTAEIFRDHPSCEKTPSNFIHEKKTVEAGAKLELPMAKGGGFAVRFTAAE